MNYRIVEEDPPAARPDEGRFAVYDGLICFDRFVDRGNAERAIARWKRQDEIRHELHELIEAFGERYSLSNREIREMIHEFA